MKMKDKPLEDYASSLCIAFEGVWMRISTRITFILKQLSILHTLAEILGKEDHAELNPQFVFPAEGWTRLWLTNLRQAKLHLLNFN